MQRSSAGFLEFIGLTKRYGTATVLDDVSVTLEKGRIHALMGENGAGKSTFIKLIAGVVRADAMTVLRNGADVPVHSAADAGRAGFRFIHQELNIVPSLSVAENILLGHRIPTRFGPFVNWRQMEKRASEALGSLGVDHIDPRLHAGALGMGDRMLMKLASSLVAMPGEEKPCLYVLDEPTAALKEAEVEKLFSVIRRLSADGAAILYVSHRLAEIETLCDDVTILRNGKLIATTPFRETSRKKIIEDMTGKTLDDSFPARVNPVRSKVTCSLDQIRTKRLKDISFDLNAGEIFGISGLAGAGQTELLRLFLGLEKPVAGTGTLMGSALPASPDSAWRSGVAYIPAERRAEGLMMRMGVRSNMLLPHLKGALANLRHEKQRSNKLGKTVRLKAEGPEQSVWQLSGGNQQKIVFARALAGNPELLLLDEPTRGVDIGARFEIYSLVRELSEAGTTVIMASSDLPELFGMCDRILVLQDGRQTAIIETDDLQRPGDILQSLYQDHHEKASA